MKSVAVSFIGMIPCLYCSAQLTWDNVDTLFSPLPASVHVYRSLDKLAGKASIAYYLVADLKDKHLVFDTDTTMGRRSTPSQFYLKNDQPLVVVNCSFFSFQTNRNLNLVIRNSRLISYNTHTIPGRGKDTLTYWHPAVSSIGINKRRKADVAWTFTDSSGNLVYAFQHSVYPRQDSSAYFSFKTLMRQKSHKNPDSSPGSPAKWKMKTAVGGGPVLIQEGKVMITNNEERKFAGDAIFDKHPRTAMGYTRDQRLIILVIQGRFPGIAEGATLVQEAQILLDLGCIEALNLDGGGSTCMLINGKETIRPSDANGQRALPAVFMIRDKK